MIASLDVKSELRMKYECGTYLKGEREFSSREC